MAAKSRFFDDMHPRSFPTEKKQFGKMTQIAAKPVLPAVSMIADKNRLSKAAPKRSFIKWKQQHEALFEPPSAMKFHTTNQTSSSLIHKRKTVPIQDTTAVVDRKFDLDFHKLASHQPHGMHDECQQLKYNHDDVSNHSPADAKRPEFQSMMTFSQLNRVARSEATRFDVPRERQPERQPDKSQLNPCGCRCLAVAPIETKTKEVERAHQPESDMQLVESSEKLVSRKPSESVTKEVIVDIVQEQIDIVQQQKHILMQQNEIFSLQYQIEKLLLMNNNIGNTSPIKQLHGSPMRKSIAASPNNASPAENGTLQSIVHCSTPSSPQTRKSIGVMTSFQSNEVWSPGRNQNLVSPGDSAEDTMLERINKIIKTSPPMINHRRSNGNGNGRCIPPKQTDINFSSQTLIYKTSTRNNISLSNDPKVADRSFALHLLDMKYHPATPATSPSPNRFNSRPAAIDKTKRSPSKCANDDDFVPSNISPDKYDYLIRHGLLNKN